MSALRYCLLRVLPLLSFGAITSTVLLPARTLYAQTAPSPIALLDTVLPDALINSPYAATLNVSGGVAPYTFQATNALPPGLSLSASGVVSGTATVQSRYQVLVTIQDSAGNSSNQAFFGIQVNAVELSVSPLPPASIPLGVPFSQALTVSGGVPPYSFSNSGGNLFPPGLGLSNSGVIEGTPIRPGSYNTVIIVGDSSPKPGPNYANIHIPITVTQDTSGFTIDASSGFTSALGLHLNGKAAAITGKTLTLVDDQQFEASSAWSSVPVDITKFTTDFQFQTQGGYHGLGDGFTFTLQNSGVKALGYLGGDLGYGGIPQSVGVKFNLFNNAGEQLNSVGFYSNGDMPTFPSSVLQNGVNLSQARPLQAHLTYDGISLTLKVTDTYTNQTSAYSEVLDLPTLIGAKTAYVGFTAGTGYFTANTQILNWTYQNP